MKKDILRAALAVIAGFLAIVILVMVGFIVGPLALGMDRVFEPGTYVASTLWIVMAIVISLVAGLVGGAVCGLIAKSHRPAAIIIAIMILASIPNVLSSPEKPTAVRPDDLPPMEVFQEAGKYGYEPLISRIGHPLGGAIGVLIGSAVAQRRRTKNA